MAVAAAVGSVVNNATIGSASAKRHSPIDPSNAELHRAVNQTDCSARSGFPAARFWPTSVAAALPMSQAGSSRMERRPVVRLGSEERPRRSTTSVGAVGSAWGSGQRPY